ncbi:CHAT domain-containing protein [Roseofilum sp. BLCC_M143]|uniref:CHAT domain-containing protein n=1 Tax=Roseofilum casamattae BLCC-M143 TaxID=3022442 RepID=A0ABT7BVR0_9CYAN|nr:CHAT domain-containing protein [Roseofilum casamattae BLCC-M143]
MTQEFHLSVTPVSRIAPMGASAHILGVGDSARTRAYLVRTELVAPGVPLAEEQVYWPIADWLELTDRLIGDPLFQTPLSSDAKDLLGLGQQLYDGLFQGTIAQSWTTAQGIAHNRGQALRLRLRLKDAEIVRLPWETLHAGDRPLTTNTDILFSRYYPSSRRQPLAARIPADPLKILMVLSAPSDRQGLALDREMNQLQAEFATQESLGLNVQLDILSSPDREQLTQALEQRQYHIFHYSGHSQPSPFGGEIYLQNQENGLTEQLNGEDLAGLLVNNGICMALFNSCWSAGAGNTTLAESLLKRGIPAVLAMGDRIPDRVAAVFSQLFYRNLKREYAIDLSLNRTRQGLISAYGSKALYFALPILYLQPGFDRFSPPERPKLAEYPPPFPASSVALDEPVLPISAGDRALATIAPALQRGLGDYQAYHRDGTQLYEQGRIEDAIAAYQVAIVTNPEYLPAHYDLGLALQQQGRTEEAIAAYRNILALEPEYRDTNGLLDGLLRQTPQPSMVPDPPQPSTETLKSQYFSSWSGKILYGGAIVGTVLLVAIGIIYGMPHFRQRLPHPSLVPDPSDPTLFPDSDNPNINRMKRAIAQFTEGNIPAGATEVEALLDSGVVSYAMNALNAVPDRDRNIAEINYLWGRLVWQAIQQGDRDYSFDDARRYWDAAVRGDRTQAKYYNALAFAYYAEENYDRAEDNFAKAISLTYSPDSAERLTAYAGQALIYAREEKDSEAAAMYQLVIQKDPAHFQPQALETRDWLWTNTAIAQWQFLLDTIPQVADK